MIAKRYLNKIRDIIVNSLGEKAKVFVFGSSIRNDKFNDVDIGVLNTKIDHHKFYKAKEDLEESNLPYKVDLVDFNNVNASFKRHVFNQEVKWIN